MSPFRQLREATRDACGLDFPKQRPTGQGLHGGLGLLGADDTGDQMTAAGKT